MQVVRTRLVGLAVVAVSATVLATGLSACSTKVGAAGVVDGTRISESDVNDYVVPGGTNPPQAKSFVLTFLVKEKLYESYLSTRGGIPSDAQLASLHDSAVAGVLSSSLGTGAAADAQIDTVLTNAGVKTSFRPTILRSAELETKAFADLGKSAADFFAAVRAADIKVSISPLYGSWNLDQQDVAAATAPNFLVPTPSSSASASPAG